MKYLENAAMIFIAILAMPLVLLWVVAFAVVMLAGVLIDGKIRK
jgi:hypothetical protein